MSPKLAVLVSGSGTLLDAIVEAGIPVALVVADRPCLALEKADYYGIPSSLHERTDFSRNFDRDDYTSRLVALLEYAEITFVSMAGFSTVLGQAMFDAYAGRIINNHPSLLPDFKGHHAVRDALAAGATKTGCTIHRATVEVDDGEILAQVEVPIHPDDTEATLHARIKEQEQPLLVGVLKEQLALQGMRPSVLWPTPVRSSPPSHTYTQKDAPYCMQCGVQMMRAGSCHACPSCGSTSGCS